ncbi:MAG: aminotransferase class IV [Cyclobacteriaceae bacterium]|jgi:4-amino-4-deoxychorismate lyase|nr:aminotransferase class IV [Cyclobacteriaceae bacterium]
MSRLIESIRLQNGVLYNLSYHQKRVDEAITALTGNTTTINLDNYFKFTSLPLDGLFKCRVIYSVQAVERIEITPYQVRPVQSLKVIIDNDIVYNLKWEDRSTINKLFHKREHCDDVLIVKQNLVTDASYSNLAFFDGQKWITPATPLLKGVMRQTLLDQGILSEDTIHVRQLRLFKKVKLINALLAFEGPELSVSDIVL